MDGWTGPADRWVWGLGSQGGLEAGLGLWVASGLSLQGSVEQVAVSGLWVRGLGRRCT